MSSSAPMRCPPTAPNIQDRSKSSDGGRGRARCVRGMRFSRLGRRIARRRHHPGSPCRRSSRRRSCDVGLRTLPKVLLQQGQAIRPHLPEGSQPLLDLGERSRLDFVPTLLSLLTYLHQSGLAQDAQVATHPGLALPEEGRQLANRARAFQQQRQHLTTTGFGQHVEGTRHPATITPTLYNRICK
jgi:hypothetical protein